MLEIGASQPAVDLLGVAAIDLVGQHAQQKLGVHEIVIDGLAQSHVEGLEDAGQAQLLEDRDQFVSGVHRCSPR